MPALGSHTTVNLVRHPLPSRLPSGHQPPAHAQRLSDEVSDNRHGQRRTSADISGRSAAGHALRRWQLVPQLGFGTKRPPPGLPNLAVVV